MKWLVYIVLLMLLASFLKASFGSKERSKDEDDNDEPSE